MRVLVVDDEQPAREELTWHLRHDERITEVLTCDSATDALRVLREGTVDAAFLDIHMPGLTGLELAQVLSQFKDPPAIVFVTAHEGHALEAFDLHAADYLLKPVRAERLAEAIRRVSGDPSTTSADPDEQIPVERGGVVRFLKRSDVRYVEAQGDYVRLHTRGDSHLLRTPLATLEEQWQPAGFVRIHRSSLVNLAYVDEIRLDSGRCSVVVDGVDLLVSRRHTRALRDLLTRRKA